MLYKLSNLNSNLALTLGYLNPALNNSTLDCFSCPHEQLSGMVTAELREGLNPPLVLMCEQMPYPI